jgi:flagellar biogenesis protein FliO
MCWLKAMRLATAMLICVCAHAQTTQPATTAQSTLDDQPIVRGTVSDAGGATTQSVSFSATGQIEAWRVILALAIVIGLIFSLRWIGHKFFPNAGVPRSSGAMKVLTRLVISPKQQLLLIQVGKRVVVVGDSSGQMSAISEIADPDEVASMVAQVAAERSSVSAKGFGAFFHRAGAEEEPVSADSPSAPDPVIADARSEIDELSDKVRLLAAQFRP